MTMRAEVEEITGWKRHSKQMQSPRLPEPRGGPAQTSTATRRDSIFHLLLPILIPSFPISVHFLFAFPLLPSSSSRLELGFLASALPPRHRPPPAMSKQGLFRLSRDLAGVRRRSIRYLLVSDVSFGFVAVLQEGRPSRSSRPRSRRRTTTRYAVLLLRPSLPIHRPD
jgi:hypothetical protein